MKLLSELSYQDPEAWEREYRVRYDSAYTTRLDFETKGGPVFFTETPEIIRLLTDILRADREAAHLCEILPGMALGQFTRRCLIDEINLTNSIEGVRSTRREIEEVLEAAEGRNKRFYGLVQKYRMLTERKEIPLKSCEDLRKVYDDLVLAEVREENPKDVPDGRLFRKGPVSIYSPTQKEIHRGTYPEEAIYRQTEKALDFLNNSPCDILYRITVFHYLLEYIHPFYDGNGRLGRFLCSYLLSQELVPVMAYRLSYTIKENVSAYYRAFSVCNHPRSRGDLTPFLLMFLGIVKVSVENLRASLRESQSRLAVCREKLPALSNRDTTLYELYDLLTQAALFSEHGVSTREIMGCLDISTRDTLNKKLAQVSPELLVKRRRGKENYYSLEVEKIEHMP